MIPRSSGVACHGAFRVLVEGCLRHSSVHIRGTMRGLQVDYA